MQRYALVTGLSNEEPAIIELLHEGPQRPLGVGLNLPKHGRNYPYKAIKFVPAYGLHRTPLSGRRLLLALEFQEEYAKSK